MGDVQRGLLFITSFLKEVAPALIESDGFKDLQSIINEELWKLDATVFVQDKSMDLERLQYLKEAKTKKVIVMGRLSLLIGYLKDGKLFGRHMPEIAYEPQHDGRQIVYLRFVTFKK